MRLTLVWIQMTVVPTSMYFFLGDFFIWNLLGWTAPTVCQESLVDLGAEFSLPFPICSEFFRLNPWVEIMLFGPFDEGGLPALVEVTDPLAYVINYIWSILQYMLRQLDSIIVGKYMDALSFHQSLQLHAHEIFYCEGEGQIISEWLLDVFIWTKKRTKIFLYFCPSL